MSSELLTPTAWGRKVDLSRQAAHSAVRRLGIPLVDGKVDSVVATTIYRTKGRPQVRHRRSVQISQAAGKPVDDVNRVVRNGSNATVSPDEGDLHDWRTRQARADALDREHDLAVKLGKYVLVDKVMREWEVILTTMKTNLLGLGARIAPQLTGLMRSAEVQAIIDDRVWELLDDMSKGHDVGDDDATAAT